VRSGLGVFGMLAAAAIVVACSTPERTSRPPAQQGGGAGDPEVSTSLPPSEDAALVGRVLGNDGTPLTGIPVTVVRTDTGSRVDDLLAGAFTLGLACLADGARCGGEQVVDSAVTDADGRYDLTLPDAHLPGYETDDDWIVSVALPARPGELAGPVGTYELEVSTAVQEAPALVLWDVTPQVLRTGGQLRVDLPPLSALEGQSLVTQLRQQDDRVLWEQHASFEPLVLEDVPTVVTVLSRVDIEVPHAEGRTIYHQVLRAGTVAYKGDLVPPSRGATCTVTGAAILGCPFTDGALLDEVELRPGGVVTIDLGPTRDIGTVIVRGAQTRGVVVEASADGEEWTPLEIGPLGGAPGIVARSGDQLVARHVRVRSVEALSLSEVSAWPVVRLPDGGGADGDDDTSRAVPAAVAAALALAVAGGLVRDRVRRG
jgi:hypothetical protein